MDKGIGRIHIICDHIFPGKDDPTGRMSFLLGKTFSEKGIETHFYSKSYISKYNIGNPNLYFHNFKCLYSYTRKEFLNQAKVDNTFSTFRKIEFLFFWLLVKLKILKFNSSKTFIKYLDKTLLVKPNDLILMVVGNYSLINDYILSKKCKKILIATDSWYRNGRIVPDHLFSSFEKIEIIYAFWPTADKFNDIKNIYSFCYLKENSHFIRNNSLKQRIVFSYFGSIGEARDLEIFTEYVSKIDKDFVFDFYITDRDLKSKYPNINFYNPIKSQDVLKKIESTDFLFMIDNNKNFELFLQSKIYDYVSSGKPIVLFTNNDNSPNCVELKKYDFGIIINYNKDDFSSIIGNFVSKMSKSKKEGYLYDYYPNCNPEDFIDNILRKI